MDLSGFIATVCPDSRLSLDEFRYSVIPEWSETTEARVAEGCGFDQQLCRKLQQLHDFSKTATKKQTRNYSKKLAKQIAAARTRQVFSIRKGEVSVSFD